MPESLAWRGFRGDGRIATVCAATGSLDEPRGSRVARDEALREPWIHPAIGYQAVATLEDLCICWQYTFVIALDKIVGFDWDAGNARKNDKHGVSSAEAEQVFFNAPLLMVEDSKHSARELRFHALGKTEEGRLLHIVFTLRDAGAKIRVISARDMHRKERAIYEQAT